MSKILDNLYLGSYSDAKNEKFLKKNGITHIVTVGVELQTLYPQSFKYLFIPAYDNPAYKLNVYFDQIADFINNAIENEKGSVFVHCYWGISRSTTSVIAYLVKYRRMPPKKARQFVKSKRSIIFPNDGFINQLDTYAKVCGVYEEKLNASKMIKSSTVTRLYPFSKEEEEGKNASEIKAMSMTGRGIRTTSVGFELKSADKDFHCKNCAMRIFSTPDLEHDINKNTDTCNLFYLKYLPWMGFIKNPNGKMFCPNTKCNSILGYYSRKPGKCPCGKRIDTMYAIYPVRVVSSKAKGGLSKGL